MTPMIPIPERMARLPRDHRGYVIPWGVYVDDDGRPHFTINDDAKRLRSLFEELCPICGQKLWRGRWFVGGPMSAFHPRGAFADPPMHTECMRYALMVCPYLAAPQYAKRIEDRTLDRNDATPILIDPTSISRRPPVFVAVLAVGQQFCGFRSSPNVVPAQPYRAIEYWRHGIKLDAAEGRKLVDAERSTWDELIANRNTGVRVL